ncbi:MAG: alpha-L-rhamnosidase [Chloroflexota bacterium]
MRTAITQDPFLSQNLKKPWHARGQWPAKWITCPGAQVPFVAAFRLALLLTGGSEAPIRIHVSADERYELFLDGKRIGRGPERGAPDRWYYESYDLALPPGEHRLVARVWALGALAADAQMSVFPGFLLAAEGEWANRLNTGTAPWKTRLLTGYTFIKPFHAQWKGACVQMDGTPSPWDEAYAANETSRLRAGWQEPQVLGPGIAKRIGWTLPPSHLLHPATLPPMFEEPVPAGNVRYVGDACVHPGDGALIRAADSLPNEVPAWEALLAGTCSLIVPAHTQRRAIVDLNEYYCAFPEVVTSNGKNGKVRLNWAEALYETPNARQHRKGNRNEIEGKYFFGQGDTFLPDGSTAHTFEPLWWSAGRYLEIVVETAEEPLIVERLALHERRYPLEMESTFESDDPRLEATTPLLVRGLQMCANETYFDCPYYEELQYGGDMRLEALVNYVMSRDDRLARKALDVFDASRLASGMTQSRYPNRDMQIIPSWTLWWVAMARDYAYWRSDPGFVRQLMPGVRATMEGFQRWIGRDGLLHAPEGWNIFDWVPEWSQDAGCPPDAVSGVSGVLNWHLVYTLVLYADLEERLNEPLLAERAAWQAIDLAQRATQAFWDEERGLLADDLAHRYFSEHTQCLALLSDQLTRPRQARLAEGLLGDPHLARTTVYASHYLFETYRKLHRVDALFERLPLWFDLVANGFKTGVEKPEPSRSDCHGWSSHPLYHYFATILGIRPGNLGFCSVEIIPQLGPLTHACGRLVHPNGGEIVLEVQRTGNELHGKIRLPGGIDAMLHVNGKTLFFKEETKEF